MKHLKSSSQKLRELFENNITVKDIAEPLASFDEICPVSDVRTFMDRKDYDVVGVRKDGVISGYVRKPLLSDGPIGELTMPFDASMLLPESAPLTQAFSILRDSPRIFVVVFGNIGGIVTRGDLQKAPVRMWLFGLVSLLEMQFLRIIQIHYADDSWQSLINPQRFDMAMKLWEEHQGKSESIGLADYLQFADKRDILLETDSICSAIGVKSKKHGKRILGRVERLRNNLAHSQDISFGNWPDLIDIVAEAESILRGCEKIEGRYGTSP